jgi:8-oxo-dGTP pyrophosphatase MutT (NUDIX family)
MDHSIKDQIRRVLSGRERKVAADSRLRKAAVLMPMYEDGDGLQIMFTRRSEEMPQHKGQIAFPGGLQHPDDPSLRATALREAEEEIGLRAGDVEILGELDDTATATTNFIVTPFVGLIPHPYTFRVNPAEIVELIPLPLPLLRDPSRFREELWDRDGAKIPVYFYNVGSHVIWGLTARILKQFLEAVFPRGTATL